MVYNVIACGETGGSWDGHGLSIGVNDCEKFGHKVAALVLVNMPACFSDRRLDVIKACTGKVYTDEITNGAWRKYFRDPVQLDLTPWHGTIKKGRVHHADTSPFVAMSLAYSLGASKIVLWGVDFQNHHIYSPGKLNYNVELLRYQSLAGALRRTGCPVYVGDKRSALAQYLPVDQKD